MVRFSNRTLSNCIPLKHQLFWSILKIKEDEFELLKHIYRDRTVFLSFSKIWIHQTTTYLCHLTWSLKLLSLPSEKAKVLVFYELTAKYAIVKQEPVVANWQGTLSIGMSHPLVEDNEQQRWKPKVPNFHDQGQSAMNFLMWCV